MIPLSVAMSGFPRAVLLVVVTSALLRVGLHGRGIAGFAWLVAGLSVLGTLTQVSDAFFPFAAVSALLFAGWVASVAVVLRRRTVSAEHDRVAGGAALPSSGGAVSPVTVS